MKRTRKKIDPWRLGTGMPTLAPQLDSVAWEKAEVERQPAMQRLKARDFGFGDAPASTARETLAAFATGELPAAGELVAALEAMVDPERDATALEVKGEPLGIEDTHETVDQLLDLAACDRNLFDLCVAGKFVEAIRAIPARGYADSQGMDTWGAADVLNLVDCLIRYWMADALHDAARNCREQIFNPTALDVLDGPFTGTTPRMNSIADRLDGQLRLFEKVSELYHRNLRTEQRDPSAMDDAVRSVLTFRLPSSTCTIAPRALLCHYGRGASEEETQFLRDIGLEAIANLELKRLRAEHGDQLEAIIEARMDWARRKMAQLRREVDVVLEDKSRGRGRAYNRWGISPQARLWLACEAAVAWALPVKADVKSPLTLAFEAARSSHGISRPRPHRHNVRKVRELFYALRCTTVRDPEHLPDTLREIELPDGGTVTGSNYTNVVQLRGRAFGFAEVWGEMMARDTHAGREIISTRFAGEAKKFLEGHGTDGCDYCSGKRPCPVFDGRWEVAERWLRR